MLTCIAQLTRVPELTLAREVRHKVKARTSIQTRTVSTVINHVCSNSSGFILFYVIHLIMWFDKEVILLRSNESIGLVQNIQFMKI